MAQRFTIEVHFHIKYTSKPQKSVLKLNVQEKAKEI